MEDFLKKHLENQFLEIKEKLSLEEREALEVISFIERKKQK